MDIVEELKNILIKTQKRKLELEKFAHEYSEFYSKSFDFEEPLDLPKVSELADGDLILLHPSLLSANSRPVTAMVLSIVGAAWDGSKHQNSDCVVVTPISPLKTPAFSWELKVDENSESTVLQLWNTRCVPEHLVKRCWKVGQYSQTTVDDAFDVYEHWEGKPLPSRLVDRTSIQLESEASTSVKDYYNREYALVSDLEL